MATEIIGAPSSDKRDTFTIPDANLGKLSDAILKANRKAAKLGVKPISWDVVSTEDIQVPKRTTSGSIVRDEKGQTVLVWARFHTVKVVGEPIHLNGWTFVATIQHITLDNGSVEAVVAAAPGEECPTRFRSALAIECDHCHTRRARTDTFVVRHEGGRYAHVGRNCLAAFIGAIDPEKLAARMEWLGQFHGIFSGFEGGSYEQNLLGLGEFLGFVAGQIKRTGWLSKSKARDTGEQSTCERALTAIRDVEKNGVGHKADWRSEPTWVPDEADKALAGAAIDWAVDATEDDESLNDYLHNVRIVVRRAAVDPRSLGIAASIIPVYQREQAKLVEKANAAKLAKVSEWVGVEGKRQDFVGLTVLFCKELESQYGVTFLYRLVDGAGNIFTWFASNDILDVGAEYTLKATVKKHETYNNAKQTVITRAAIVKQTKTV